MPRGGCLSGPDHSGLRRVLGSGGYFIYNARFARMSTPCRCVARELELRRRCLGRVRRCADGVRLSGRFGVFINGVRSCPSSLLVSLSGVSGR